MKLSIATSYYNRKPQFINTLKTINRSKQINNLELIVVDDCSSNEHRLEDIVDEFPFIKIIRLEKKDKWYVNPCIPFNKAIKEATGDVIILQNPECLHVGDILDDIVNTINDNTYITYGIYSLDREMTNRLYDLPYENDEIFNLINSRISPLNNFGYSREGITSWYNHSKYRPAAYHFLSAITKINMNKLNGFDERYSNGIGFDDDELLFRIKLLGLDVLIHDTPFAIHQWHYNESRPENIWELFTKNQNLFNMVTKKLTTPYVI